MKIKFLTSARVIVIASLVGMVSLVGCSESGNTNQVDSVSTDSSSLSNTVQVEHKYGTTEVKSNPSKVVVLDIGALETMHELGIKATGIPKKFLPEYFASMRSDENIADVGSVIEPNFEAIAALKPELIFISTRQERFYEELKEIAPTVYIGTDNKNYMASFEQNVHLIGKIFGKEKLAEEKLTALINKINQAKEKYEKDEKKALFLIYNNGKFAAFGKGSRFGFIHDVLHIKPVMDLQDESVHGQRVSNELIVEANPDYLFIVDRNAAVLGKIAKKEEIENKLIKQTKAFKNNQIFYLDPNVWFISGGGLTSVNLMVDDVLALIK